MEKPSNLFSDGFIEFNKKLTRLGCVAKTLQEEAIKSDEESCSKCRGDRKDYSSQSQPHIQDLCPADREKIAQLVEKLAECTQAKHKAEAELAAIQSENEALTSRYEIRCNEHEIEKNHLKEQLNSEKSRAKILKNQSTRSLDALGEQLDSQEKEFVKLTETVKDLLREKIQLQNILIEKESRMKIAEAKLERAKETLEMEKLLFMKEHVKDSVIRTLQNRACQTIDDDKIEKKPSISYETKNPPTIKSKNDLEDASSDAILLRSLFFKSNTYDDDDDDEDSPINLLYHPIKN